MDALLNAIDIARDAIRARDAGDQSTETGWASDELLDAWLRLDTIADLVKALEPFAKAADRADEMTARHHRMHMSRLTDKSRAGGNFDITFGDLRRARAALEKARR